MELHLLLAVALRATIVYAFLLVVIRLLGKRSVGIHAAFDLVVAIILADLASEAITGGVPLSYALFAVALVAGWHYVGRLLHYQSPRLQRWLGGGPTVIIRDGQLMPHALQAERLSAEELWSLLRHHGIEQLTEVRLACVEPSGQLSIIRQEWAREARACDLREALEKRNA